MNEKERHTENLALCTKNSFVLISAMNEVIAPDIMLVFGQLSLSHVPQRVLKTLIAVL